jgi:hypothetical protein
MVQDALLVALIGMAAFFLLIPASIWLLKGVLGGEESESVEEVDTNGRSEPPRQGSSA